MADYKKITHLSIAKEANNILDLANDCDLVSLYHSEAAFKTLMENLNTVKQLKTAEISLIHSVENLICFIMI